MRNAGVEVHAVDTLQFEDDVIALEISNGGWQFHGGSGWAFVPAKMQAPPHVGKNPAFGPRGPIGATAHPTGGTRTDSTQANGSQPFSSQDKLNVSDGWLPSLALSSGQRNVKLASTFPRRHERWVRDHLVRTPRVVCWCAQRIRSIYTAYPAAFSGMVFGLAVPILGLYSAELGGAHELVGHRAEPSDSSMGIAFGLRSLLCVPLAWLMFAGWLAHSLGCGYFLPAVLLASVACATYLFCLVSSFHGWVRRHGASGKLVACGVASVLVGGYVWTWVAGGKAVRDAIRQDCERTQAIAHMSWPGVVPAEPIHPELYYCFPVLPGVLVSEHCFLYGPLMGRGGQDLWAWDGISATTVYGLYMWNH